jgi:hypothetical protein
MAHYLLTSNSQIAGGVYLLDSRSGEVQRVLRGSFRGITRGPDGAWYTVTGSRNTTKDTSTIHRLELSTLDTEIIAEYPVKDSHDLKWVDGHFYLVGSVGNQVLRLDAQGQLVDRIQIVEHPDDICHVNCLIGMNGGVYCTVFTLSPGTRREKTDTGLWHTEGKLLRLDWERKSYEVVHEPLCQPHSLVERPDGVYLVESHVSTVTRLDRATGKSKRIIQYYGFLRGLSIEDDETLLGVCVMYTKTRKKFRPLPWYRQLQERYFPFAGVLIMDPSWKVRKKIAIPHAEVYDIVRLDDGEQLPCHPRLKRKIGGRKHQTGSET